MTITRHLGKGLALAALAAFLAASPGGACHARDLDSVGAPRTPLVLLLNPAHGAHVAPARLAALGRYLTTETAMAVDVWVAPSDEAAIHAISANRADVALMPLFDYLLLHREYGARAGLRVLRAGADRYGGEFLVKADSPIETLRDLAGRKVAFVGPWSTSGFVLPAKMLTDAGARPEAIFTGSHRGSLALLHAGMVDAAITYAGAGSPDPSLRVLATTPTVPNEPVFFRRGLAQDKRARVERALLKYIGTPEGSSLFADIADVTGLAPTTDAAYAEAVQVLRDHGRRLEDLVADGWRIANGNQLPLSSYAP